MEHRSVYAARGKIGVIVPPTNTVNEAEWQRLMPPQVTFHTTRMRLHAEPAHLWEDLAGAVGMLTPARPDVIAYACTAGSMISPPQSVTDRMAGIAGVPCVTTASAMVQALEYLGARRVVIATPYHDALNTHEVAFLAACGIETLAIAGLGIGAGGPHEYPQIAETPIEQVYRHAAAVWREGAQALLISCTDFPALPLVPRLEAELGVPVVTSNTATLWAALRLAGVGDAIAGGGRLLAQAVHPSGS